jgi:hypothetical protein
MTEYDFFVWIWNHPGLPRETATHRINEIQNDREWWLQCVVPNRNVPQGLYTCKDASHLDQLD